MTEQTHAGDGLAQAFSLIMGDRPPYNPREWAAKTYEIPLYGEDPIRLRAGDFAGCFANITYRNEYRAASELAATVARIAKVKAAVDRWIGEADPAAAAKAAETFDSWARRHVEFSTAYIRRHQGMASAMVTGPSNFPARRQEKLQRWADNHFERLQRHVELGFKWIRREAFPFGAPGEAIRANNPEAPELLRQKVEGLEAEQARMKAMNAARDL